MGYNLNEDYYIIKNSWGKKWGEDGFAKIRMRNDCWLSREIYNFGLNSPSYEINLKNDFNPYEQRC